MDRKGIFKKYSKAVISRYSKVVYNIKLPFAYSDFTVHMLSQLLAGSFVGTKAEFSHDVPFFSHARAPK